RSALRQSQGRSFPRSPSLPTASLRRTRAFSATTSAAIVAAAAGRAVPAPAGAEAAAGAAAARARATATAVLAAEAAVLAAVAPRGAGSHMGIGRIARHLIEHNWRARRVFTSDVLAAIEQAIKTGEATHSGQVRFVVEGALDGRPLFHNQSARE